ncbi:YveK family protein [Bacillus salipaludis]|uniref:Wzz/FepE/Etk N-terminal domain-containing protein n=1 Tax=Bacillus salipaludis TaxID=2547811 RepID=A0AA90QJY3_9BACI|nr:Wzz/FepE/Etk N-terminal domain-containing protein [Bacillus salipaludis]MDQ6595015.1 Wzz/FepE/Etk N-terminal domain-containing protein [Bacillus salipaludis]
MEETISLKELLETLKKRIVLIVSITLIAAIASGVISYFYLTPIYQASTQILVSQTKDKNSIYNPNEVQTNLQLINTYIGIIKSPVILEKVAEELNSGITADQISKEITVANETNSQLINITIQDANAQQAADIANTTTKVVQKEIVKNLKADNVTIWSEAKVSDNPSPVKPRKLLNIAIATVVGLMTGVGLSFLLEYFNNTIKNEQDVENILELPILGVIATIDDKAIENAQARKAKRGETIGS